MDPNDNKAKIDWFSLKKIVLGTVREDQFLYILLKLITSTVLIAPIFFSQFSDPLSLKASLLFYTIFFLSSLPSTCKADCWC